MEVLSLLIGFAAGLLLADSVNEGKITKTNQFRLTVFIYTMYGFYLAYRIAFIL